LYLRDSPTTRNGGPLGRRREPPGERGPQINLLRAFFRFAPCLRVSVSVRSVTSNQPNDARCQRHHALAPCFMPRRESENTVGHSCEWFSAQVFVPTGISSRGPLRPPVSGVADGRRAFPSRLTVVRSRSRTRSSTTGSLPHDPGRRGPGSIATICGALCSMTQPSAYFRCGFFSRHEGSRRGACMHRSVAHQPASMFDGPSGIQRGKIIRLTRARAGARPTSSRTCPTLAALRPGDGGEERGPASSGRVLSDFSAAWAPLAGRLATLAGRLRDCRSFRRLAMAGPARPFAAGAVFVNLLCGADLPFSPCVLPESAGNGRC